MAKKKSKGKRRARRGIEDILSGPTETVVVMVSSLERSPAPPASDAWKKEYRRLWDTLVPRSGRAETLQGELIRIAGKYTDEAYRNANQNWCPETEQMWRFLGETLDDPKTFSATDRRLIKTMVKRIIDEYDCPDTREDGSPFYILTEKAVVWCLAHPKPIPYQ
jgi:hypothetical protein